MTWSDLPASKRDLLVAVAVVNRDDDRRASGVVVIDELRERFGYDGRKETYYVGLSVLRERGLIDVSAPDDDGADARHKYYCLTPDAVTMLHRHRADVDDARRAVA